MLVNLRFTLLVFISFDVFYCLSGQVVDEANSCENSHLKSQNLKGPHCGQYKWWFQIAIFTVFVLSGQTVATLLGRLYFNKGGKSIWMLTLMQTAGFPVLLPFICISPPAVDFSEHNQRKPPALIVASVYILLGLFLAVLCMLYTIGLLYLPVSTYSLICATQLGFNVVFSFFLNAQKFTPLIMNSVFILMISSTLLAFQRDSLQSTFSSKGKYTLGFVMTVVASAGYALMLSVIQVIYQKILKKETLRVVLVLSMYQEMIATSAILLSLLSTGQWRSLRTEMKEFELGTVLYVLTLVCKALSWQVFAIGTLGLIFKVSSLFSNVISTLGLPIVPVLAVILFHDEMNGVKVVSMILAIWGFLSYMYQHYLDDLKLKAEGNVSRVLIFKNVEEVGS